MGYGSITRIVCGVLQKEGRRMTAQLIRFAEWRSPRLKRDPILVPVLLLIWPQGWFTPALTFVRL
jgi:hypothetical protein